MVPLSELAWKIDVRLSDLRGRMESNHGFFVPRLAAHTRLEAAKLDLSPPHPRQHDSCISAPKRAGLNAL